MSLYQPSSSRSNRIDGSDQEFAQTIKAAPLLLKPNGAPVFQNVPEDEIGKTMKRAQETAELERTVKAHSFVLGKKIQNSTEIQKSAAQEQSFPVKVLYVKPGIVKMDKRKNSQPGLASAMPTLKKNETSDLEVSMGEISGIFKKDKKRVQSAPQKEAEKRKKAQKAYAEQVKIQNKIKEELRQKTLAERGRSSGDAAPPKEEEPKLEIPKTKLPHSQNRYQGKFDSMTKELFKKAQEKLREELNKTKSSKEDQKARKQREAIIQEEIKQRNREKVLKQKESGIEPQTLKQQEEIKKYEKMQKENNEMRQKRREQAQKSREDRARQLALNNVSQKKLAELQQKKLIEKLEREEQERIQELVNRQEAMMRKAALNKDIIDFTDPKLGMPSPPVDEEEVNQPDEEAIKIQQKEARQRALIETRQKRKQQELMKKLAEDEEKQKKQQMMAELEFKLQQQREEFARKQRMAQEKNAKEAQKRVKESKKSSRGNTKDRSNQLNDLRNWIDEQMNLDDTKKSEKSPRVVKELPQDPDLLKYQLPGNSLLPLEDERRISVRQNRYGIHGDNGYDEIAGFSKPADSILDFVQQDSQEIEVKSEDSYDKQPIKLEKRKIVNQPLEDPTKFNAPGMLNLKQEAERQKQELLLKQTEAATVMQKWARGWEARKRVNKLRYRTRKDIEQGYTDYTENFKINDKFNLNRFLNEKQRLREKYGTDVIDDDSISEQIGEASIDIQTESYIKSQILGGSSSRPAPAVQNFFAPPMSKNMEYDPLSLISLYAKRNAVAASPEQLIPEKEKPSKPRGKSGPAPVRLATKEAAVLNKRSKSNKQTPKKQWDDEISEDIIQSSKAEEQYSDNFDDDHITESIPSYKGPVTKESESIAESIVVQSAELRRKDSAKISESIPEESGLQASIPEDDIPEEVIESKEDVISEASYLRNSASSEIKESIAGSGAKVAAPPPKKIERIREKIKEDFDNDGHETYQSIYKAQEIKKQQEEAKNERDRQYRMSKQIIQDYEENKNVGSDAHKQIMKDLTEELNRYEAAVSGSIFVEQFKGIVEKNLAKKDIMMLGQRLSQLEAENKHKQEIADIRAEQIRMMSQLMLLNAGGGNLDKKSSESLRLHQEEIMGNIQKLIEKPIIIEQKGLDDEIIESIKDSVNFRASMSQSKAISIKESLKIKESIQDDVIESEIHEEKDSEIDESIQESIQLSNARRVLGSEKTVIQQSKDMLSDKKKSSKAASPFEKNTFQNYTSDKFKDLLFNDGSMMDDFLDQIEVAVAKKSESEKKQLKRQLDQRKISPKTYSKKAKDLEKWVTGERAEINQKRIKVKETCNEIGVFMKKIEQDKQLIMDAGIDSARSTPRKFGYSQNSVSVSGMGLKQIQEQLEDIRAGTIGGNRPETKYINKKREFVRQLMMEKKEAIDKGVKDRMKDLESDMIDEMMQAALNLDVENEIEKRIALAKQMVEDGKIDESASKSVTSQKKNKKNVQFYQPSPKAADRAERADRYSSSGSYNQQHESSLRSRSNKIGESMGQDDMIGESIAMEESLGQSVGQSSAKKSKVDSSGKLSASAPKSNKMSEKIDEQDENSLSRDEDEIEEEDIYSNDFASQSIKSATVSSKVNKLGSSSKNEKIDVEESNYSEAFDEASNMGQSQTQSKGLKSMTNNDFKDIDIVDEEDYTNPEEEMEEEEVTQSKASPEQSANIDPSMSDREILESTRSVQWEIQLQERKRSPEPESPAPEPEQTEETVPEEATEQNISEEYDVQADDMQDLESNPTGSLQNSYPKEEEDMEDRADEITEELLQQILNDFQNDTKVKMVVEDDIDEDEFEDKWPYTLDKKVEEPEKPMTPSLPQPQAAPVDEKSESDIAKQRHDILLKKYHAEQDMIKQNHLKTKEYLEFITQIVDKEVLQQNLQKPIEHDPLKILEKIQAFDTEDEIEMTNMTNSQQQSALPTYLFDEIQKRYEEIHSGEKKSEEASIEENTINVSQEARQVHHLAIFDAFNEALDLERPYKFKGLPNPWSKQTRITNENLSSGQVDQIVQKAMNRVIQLDLTGAGTKFAPAPPPPPLNQEYDSPYAKPKQSDEDRKQVEKLEEDERNKAERSERLGILLTKEVHQKENDWLDYEIEDTQVRFDLADMILEELADEVTQFLIIKQQPNIDVSGAGSSQSYE